MSEEQALRRIWDYMLLGHELRPADMLLILCSYDLRVAEWGAELFLDGWAPLVTISGGGFVGGITGSWDKPEARIFAEALERRGVPAEKILIEDKSKNTGENAYLTGELWKQQWLDPRTVIAATKPYMERRAYATLMKWWPNREIVVTSPPVGLEEWVEHSGIDRRKTEDALVGDVWRIRNYPKVGFQIEQEIPDDVWAAYEFLVSRGYGRPERPGPKTRPE